MRPQLSRVRVIVSKLLIVFIQRTGFLVLVHSMNEVKFAVNGRSEFTGTRATFSRFR